MRWNLKRWNSKCSESNSSEDAGIAKQGSCVFSEGFQNTDSVDGPIGRLPVIDVNERYLESPANEHPSQKRLPHGLTADVAATILRIRDRSMLLM
jgi:hypothetical protein